MCITLLMSCHSGSNQNNLKNNDQNKNKFRKQQAEIFLVSVLRGFITCCLSLIATRWQTQNFWTLPGCFLFTSPRSSAFCNCVWTLIYGYLNRAEAWENCLQWYYLVGLLVCLIWGSRLQFPIIKSPRNKNKYCYLLKFSVRGIEL